MGRPRLVIDEHAVAVMAGIGCPVDEIATILGVDERTLQRRFATVLEKGRSDMRRSLRSKQVELALRGDKTMLVWLGKQLLGQTDRNDVQMQHSGHVGVSVDLSALSDDELRRIAESR